MNKVAIAAVFVLVALVGILIYHQSQIVRYDAGENKSINGTSGNFSPGDGLGNSSFDNETEICVVQQCHGPDFTCGNRPRNMACTLQYALGDRCERYFSCAIVNGQCQEQKQPEFAACADCARECDAGNCSTSCQDLFQKIDGLN